MILPGLLILNYQTRRRRIGILKAVGLEPPEAKSPDNTAKGGFIHRLISSTPEQRSRVRGRP